ncbi:MAG: tRNA uridine-5-carboxymethylaminomethyl(34) synthesis GTPase MnmE [Pseudomonadota bacterium]
MKILSNTDTICAQATPPGPGGLGVVRISGPDAFDILVKVWRSKTGDRTAKPRQLYLGEAITSNREVIDKVMAVRMPAPHTYTGQNVVELSCHGSPIILSKIVDACVAAGARIARPGEFTRRAFLSGKMDLAQAEAVCDLISATSERGARLATEQLEGKLSKEIRDIASNLVELRSLVEAWIDFPEEEIDLPAGSLEDSIANIAKRLEALASTYKTGKLIRDGVRVAIVGRPNVGKSSILNCLTGHDRALVHHAPGTTRDVIEESASFEGVVFRFRDTAGIRHTPTEVEAMGIDRACDEIKNADLALVVFDGSIPFGAEDKAVLKQVGSKLAILAINKHDLPQQLDASTINNPIHISAKTGDGVDALLKHLTAHALNNASCISEGATVASARHKEALTRAEDALRKAQQAHSKEEPLECIAQHLRIAQDSLGTITGEVATEDLLDQIFSRFCIGK